MSVQVPSDPGEPGPSWYAKAMADPDRPLCSYCGKKPVLVMRTMLCSNCTARLRRRGTLDAPRKRLPKGSPTLDRFEFYVLRSEEPDGCWLWQGASLRYGYGQFWDGTRVSLAHRWSYEHFVGPIPDDLVIDHTCETPRCVRPDHLEVVTGAVNTQRGGQWPHNPDIPRADRVNLELNRPNCLQCGLPYTTDKSGKRVCRPCTNAKARRNHRRRNGVRPSRQEQMQARTHCAVCGFPYDEENTYLNPKTGARDCKNCRKRRRAESLARHPPARGRRCPPGCTCGRHSRGGNRRRKEAA